MIRLALIGSGIEGEEQVARAILRFRDVELTAIVMEPNDSGQRMERALKGCIVVPTFEALLAEYCDIFDAAIIQSCPRLRAVQVCKAAAAGKHILVSTPMARSTAEAEQVVIACKSAGVKLMVGNSWRFRPSIVMVKQALDSGKLGRPSLLRIHAWSGSCISSAIDEIVDGTQPQAGTWPELFDVLDLAQWFFGEHPIDVVTLVRPDPNAMKNQVDFLQSHLAFKSGGMALISLSHSLPAGANYNCLTMIGSSGAAYADDHDQTQLLYQGRFPGGFPQTIKTGEGLQVQINMFREFVESIQQDRSPNTTVEDGRAAIAMVEAVLNSANCGLPVHISGD